jgi:hypothetical protein
MTLIDPRDDLAEQSSFIGYLVGIAGLAQLVRTLAASGDCRFTAQPGDADDFVHMLLGVASLGQAVERTAETAVAQQHRAPDEPSVASANTRWLR